MEIWWIWAFNMINHAFWISAIFLAQLRDSAEMFSAKPIKNDQDDPMYSFYSFTHLAYCSSIFFYPSYKLFLLVGLRLCWLYQLNRGKTLTQKKWPGYDTTLHQMVRLPFWRSEKCWVPLHLYRCVLVVCPRGVMVKAMNCGIVVREFVLQSRYYVHFRANTLGKGMNPLILPPAMGK